MEYIYGRKPVLEALKTETPLEKIIIQYGQKSPAINEIKSLAKKQKVRVSELPPAKFNSILKEKNTQGIIALKSPQKDFSLDEIISSSKESKYPFLLLLDSIQDPHNLGAILRSAECSGIDGVITTIHNSAPITEVVEKTSAGALSHLKIVKVSNLNQTIKILKDEGFWIVGSTLENAQNYTGVDYKMPVALIMGNEEKGIRKLVADNCDFLVKIPMPGHLQSLNVSVAAGVLLFEIVRQRRDA